MSPDEMNPLPRELRFIGGETSYAGVVYDRGASFTILALPDWRGRQTDYALRRGIELGEATGANVVVSDLFGAAYRPASYSGDAEHWIADALSDARLLRQRLTGYVEALTESLAIEPSDLVAVGYCLGGALAFEMGRADLGLSAVVSIHGIPSTSAPIKALSRPTRFLAIHGASDPIIGMDHVAKFEAEMTAADVDWTSLVLGHARHGFSNEEADPNGMHQRFDLKASRRSLAMLAAFLPDESSP
jgi:dienelactone hydrolase